MAKIRFIKSPSPGTVEIIKRRLRAPDDLAADLDWTAVGLVQANVAEALFAADVAEKTAQVQVLELTGTCPQHLTTLAVFGETAAVAAALDAVAAALARNGA